MVASFAFSTAQPKLHGELGARRSLRRMGLVVLASFAFVFVIYIGSAVAGYVLKGADTKSDILLSFDEGDGPIVVARIALSVVVISCYPLAFNSLRIALVSLLPVSWAERIKAPHYPISAYAPDELEDDTAFAAAAGDATGVDFSAAAGAGGYMRVPLAQLGAAAADVLGGAAATPSAVAAAGVESSGLDRGVSSAELTATGGSASASASGSASPSAGGSLVRRNAAAGAASGAGSSTISAAAAGGASAASAATASPLLLPVPLRRPRAASQRWTAFRLCGGWACTLPTCRATCINVRADWAHALITKLTVLISLTIAILVPNIEVSPPGTLVQAAAEQIPGMFR